MRHFLHGHCDDIAWLLFCQLGHNYRIIKLENTSKIIKCVL